MSPERTEFLIDVRIGDARAIGHAHSLLRVVRDGVLPIKAGDWISLTEDNNVPLVEVASVRFVPTGKCVLVVLGKLAVGGKTTADMVVEGAVKAGWEVKK